MTRLAPTPRTAIAFALLIGGAAGAQESDADIRRAIEAQYARIPVAMARRDVDALVSMQDSAYRAVNPAIRQAFGFAEMAEYMRRQLASIDSLILQRNTIRAFTVRGVARDTAIADVCQEFSRMQRVGDAGSRRVDTSVLQRETWVRRPAGWRRLEVSDVHGVRWFVDGVRVEPGRPYTAGMPAYRPDPDPPTGCGSL